MKKIINILFVILVAVGFSACNPQEDNSYTLGDLPHESQVSFTATASAAKANIIELKNTSQVPGIVTWSFGNGGTGKGDVVSAPYPLKGEYTVVMTLYTKAGTISKTELVKIKYDDFSLLDTPGFNALTGGASKPEGKTWVFDQYYSGHFGVGPNATAGPFWWSCAAEGKLGSSLYTQEFTFIQDGTKLIWKNNGYIYTSDAGVTDLGITDFINNPAGVGDNDVKYQPAASYTFTFNESAMELTLSKGAFLGFYIGPKNEDIKYQVLKLNEDQIYLMGASTLKSGDMWFFRLIPKEKNIKPEVSLRAVALKETFENEKSSVVFKKEDMGTLFSQWYQNPAPVPVNTSSRVCLYHKTDGLYSNISWTAMGYKFDLTEQNKISLKVFIPSFNNYDGNLKPQVAVKLQNSDAGGNAWQSQKEIVKENLPIGEWIDLKFDFSEVKDEKNYDKIVIQFGGEGHTTTGIFYFDDFTFSK